MPTFPSDFPVPIVIVQHMPPVFTKSLAKRLSGVSALDVQEAAEGDVLQPGTAWIAPGNYHMALAREQDRVRITLNQDSPENSCRPAVDVLFRSVAGIYGSHALAVILTGMGSDGLAGGKHLADCGSQVIVQDEDSSVVWGMPGVVARAGLAESVLPLNQVGAEIIRRTRFERTTHRVRHNAPF
jgi:two-component system chemotaxis response regulator CheB